MARYSRNYGRSRSYSRTRSNYGRSYGRSSYRSSGSRYKRNGGFSTRTKNGYSQYNSGNGWKFTHRRVAEKKLGGRIRSGYEVHHINRNKRDNRPSNLTVIPKWKHRKIHGR